MSRLTARFDLPSGKWVFVREISAPDLADGGTWAADTQYGHHFRIEGNGRAITGRTREQLLRDAFERVERELVSRERAPGNKTHVLVMERNRDY